MVDTIGDALWTIQRGCKHIVFCGVLSLCGPVLGCGVKQEMYEPWRHVFILATVTHHHQPEGKQTLLGRLCLCFLMWFLFCLRFPSFTLCWDSHPCEVPPLFHLYGETLNFIWKRSHLCGVWQEIVAKKKKSSCVAVINTQKYETHSRRRRPSGDSLLANKDILLR